MAALEVGLYNGKVYTDHFTRRGEASISDPDPGSYLVTVASTNGYSCAREVGFIESTPLVAACY